MDKKLLLKPVMTVNSVTHRRRMLPSAYHVIAMLIDVDPGVPFDATDVLNRLTSIHTDDGSIVRVEVGKYTFLRVVGDGRGRTPVKDVYILNALTGDIRVVVGIREAARICECTSASVSNACDVDRVLSKKYFICSSKENAERQFAAVKERGSLRKPPSAKPVNARTVHVERKLLGVQISFEGVDTYTANSIADAAEFLDCSVDTVRDSLYGRARRLIYGHVVKPIYAKVDEETV